MKILYIIVTERIRHSTPGTLYLIIEQCRRMYCCQSINVVYFVYIIILSIYHVCCHDDENDRHVRKAMPHDQREGSV